TDRLDPAHPWLGDRRGRAAPPLLRQKLPYDSAAGRLGAVVATGRAVSRRRAAEADGDLFPGDGALDRPRFQGLLGTTRGPARARLPADGRVSRDGHPARDPGVRALRAGVGPQRADRLAGARSPSG